MGLGAPRLWLAGLSPSPGRRAAFGERDGPRSIGGGMMNDGAASPLRRLGEPFERGRVRSISAAPQRRQIVLVVGVHRSGTSLCSHVLSALGLDMADMIAPPG